MTRAYVLSPGAAVDLRDITRYTLDTWGAAQGSSYIKALEDAAMAMATGKGSFKERDDILPGLRMVWSGKHCIFCMPQPDGPALILAVLHERMDIIARLGERQR